MTITFEHVLPTPLAAINHGKDSIWGNNAVFESDKRILLNASSGKGKSTFTGIVSGLRTDYAGIVSFDNRAIETFSIDEWTNMRREKIAVVFQDLQLFPNLTVQENLQLKNNLTDFRTEQELRALLTRLEIEDKWQVPCGILSMGQQQRVAIIRALCQPFSWLVMDEPFSHLDERNKANCLQLIVEETTKQAAGFVLTSLDADQRFAYDYELKL